MSARERTHPVLEPMMIRGADYGVGAYRVTDE